MSVTLETMNYACVVFVGIIVISAVWYWVWGYKNYAGPPTDAIDPEADHPAGSSPVEVAKDI
jgi:hypothetical protein